MFMGKGKITAVIASFLAVTTLVGCNQNKGYTIKWLNDDGTVLEIDKNVKKGEMPTYDGETPTKAEDEQYRYEFLNWYTAPVPADKSTSYIAQFYPISKTKDDNGIDVDPVDLAIKAGKALIENFVPHGKQIIAVATAIINAFKKDEKGQEVSLKDIKDDIAQLRSELINQYQQIENQLESLSEQQRQIESKLETIIVAQTTIAEKGNNFDTLLTTLQATARQINTIQNDTSLSEQDKAVQLALLIGRNDKWIESSNLYNQYLNFLNTITGTTFGDIKGKDLITLIYESYLTNSLFTGEAKCSTEVYLDQVVYLALYAYSICAECLKAAEEVSCFTSDDVAELNDVNKGHYNNNEVTSLYSIVTQESTYLNTKVFAVGLDETSFADRMNAFYNDGLNRHIFTNCGTANVALSDNLLVRSFKDDAYVNDGSEYDSWSPQTYIDQLDKNTQFGANHRRALVNHAKANFSGTMREYLTALGYDLTAVTENAWFYMETKETSGGGEIDPHTLHGYTYMTIGFTAVSIDDIDYTVVDQVEVIKAKVYTDGKSEYVPVEPGCFVTIRA